MFFKKLKFALNLIFGLKLRFLAPEKNKILIFDKESSEINCKILGLSKYGILHTRREELYFPIIFNLLIRFKLNSLNYCIKYIELSKAKIIITFIDNNFLFYRLKKHFKSKIFISIQNGHRMAFGDMFGLLRQKKTREKLSANMIFTFNKHIAKEYKKDITSSFAYVGSLKNNYFKKTSLKSNKKNLLFISAYRPIMSLILNKFVSSNDYEEKCGKKYKLKHRQGINFDIPKILKRYCFEKKLKLIILGASNNMKEKYFYDNLLKTKNYKFIFKKNTFSNYKEIDKSNLIISTYSTLGYEAFSRGKKICFFSPSISKFENSYSFGWPYLKTKKGFFYSNEISYDSICKILDKIKIMSNSLWLKKISPIQKHIMVYNKKNNNLVKNYIDNKLKENS